MATNRKAYQWKQFDARRWGFLRVFRRQARSAIARQIEPAVSFLEENGIEQAQYNIDAFISEQPLIDFYSLLYRTVGGQFGEREFEALSGKILKQDEAVWVRMVQQWLDTGMTERLSNVTDSSRRQIKEILNKGVADGLGTAEIARKMRQSAGGIVRATRIARTEIIASSNIGSFMGAKATGLNLQKEWISTPGERTRGSNPNDEFDHLSPNGQKVAMDDLFIISGENLLVPGDWQNGASAGNIINCRCTQGYIPA